MRAACFASGSFKPVVLTFSQPDKYNVVSGAFISIVVGVVPLCLCTAGTVDSHFILLISDLYVVDVFHADQKSVV